MALMNPKIKIKFFTVTSGASPMIDMHVSHAGEEFLLDLINLHDIESFLYAVLIFLHSGTSSKLNLKWVSDQDDEYLWELVAAPMAAWAGKPITMALRALDDDHLKSITASYDSVELAEEVARAYLELLADFEDIKGMPRSHIDRLRLSIELLKSHRRG